MNRLSQNSLRERTIADFGEQWTAYSKNEGYYGSDSLFSDLVEPLVQPSEFRGAKVADIGSGTGRIVGMLLRAGAAKVIAVEPSAAYEKLAESTAGLGDSVRCLRVGGEELPLDLALDWAVSFGVLHHIPDPDPVVRRAFLALRPGGQMLGWLYGREGNGVYLSLVQPFRWMTTRLPHPVLAALTRALDIPLRGYIALSRVAPVPMRDYMRNHLGRMAPETRRLTIYDQLNPAYARYYTEAEARALFERAGFVDVRLHHRHGYSWLVVGKRPG
jgi:SAM-dependent methyltransferase